MNFRFDVILDHLPAFLFGLWNTTWLCTVGTVLSLIAGIVLTLPLMSRQKIICGVAQTFVDAARAIPFLMLVYLVYYGLPTVGIRLDSWTTAILTLVLYNTAYIAEILRSAWANLPRGQTEAGRAYGFSGFHLLQKIILPQVLITSAPVIGNQLIQVIKDSAFLAIITVPELTQAARIVQADYFIPFESLIFAALLYWVLCLLVEFGVKHVESSRNAYVTD